MSEDPLGWLLPDAPADERSDVRRVITALRLLREDSRGRAGRRAAPSWHRARSELESLERRQRRRALDALLHAQLSALRASDSFLELGPSSLAYHEACLGLLQASNPAEAVPPPAPAEAPLEAVARLLAAGLANGASPAWHAWWDACARHATGPPAEAEQAWETLLGSALEARAERPFLARALAGLVAAHLDRFRPARAWALRARHAELATDPSLRRLLGWSALFSGEEAAARRLLEAAGAARLPAPLLELRADRPDLAALLPGAGPESGARQVRARALERAALGALLVGVFARTADGGTEILALDAPDELRPAILRRCQARWVPEGLLGGADLQRSRSTHGEGLNGSLAGPDARAQVTAAIRNASGELAGWLQLESAHQLLPSATTLADLARAWSERVGTVRMARMAQMAARGGALARFTPEGEPPLRAEPFAADDPRAEFARRLFAELALAGGVRMVWVELGAGGGARVRAEHGGTLADGRPGGAAILRRVRAERDLVGHRGELHEALRSGAARGFALPLLDPRGARVLGVLVLESARAEVLPDPIVAAARTVLRTLEPLWWSASFRAACRARDGRDLAWELSGRFLASLAPALQAAAETRAPLLLVGQRGAGRRTLARWLHFRGSPPDPGCQGADASAADPRVLELTELAPEAQRELARAAEAGEHFFLAATAPAHVLGERGLLAPALERVLDPLPLCVPPLRERRDEIPALVRVLADDVARFDDEALGALWRQDWRGNVSELGALVGQLARSSRGRELGAPDVRAAMHSRGLGFRARLSSRRPSALDLELALASTRHRSGSANLARAARYLGWDPDTLRARLEERDAPGRRTRPSSRREDGGDGGAGE